MQLHFRMLTRKEAIKLKVVGPNEPAPYIMYIGIEELNQPIMAVVSPFGSMDTLSVAQALVNAGKVLIKDAKTTSVIEDVDGNNIKKDEDLSDGEIQQE